MRTGIRAFESVRDLFLSEESDFYLRIGMDQEKDLVIKSNVANNLHAIEDALVFKSVIEEPVDVHPLDGRIGTSTWGIGSFV